MIILVEGKPALLKSGSSFEFIAENRLFMGRDSYTLTLSFPLRDCLQNRAIFGNIERMDIDKEKIFYDCEIRDKAFSMRGSLLVTGVSQTEVTCQFAEGRCEQTVTDPFEDVYINALDLGSQPDSKSYTPLQAWAGLPSGNEEVALPWVNEHSPTAFNNWVVFENNTYKWDKGAYVNRRSTTEYQVALSGDCLSWQPYLIVIAKRICEAVGYTCDFSEWETSVYKYLIVCNTLPNTWTEGHLRNYRSVLPKWTVTEFFEKLELLMMCEFDIDHRAKHIAFVFSKTALSKVQPVEIREVVEDYSVDISTDQTSCDYIGSKRLAYKECSHSMQPYYACDWFVNGWQYKEYASVSALIEANRRHLVSASDGKQYPAYGEGAYVFEHQWLGELDVSVHDVTDYLMRAANVDTYFVFRSIGVHKDVSGHRPGGAQKYVLQPVNVFGSGSEENDEVDTEEIEFVPVCVSDTYVSDDDDKGYMMFLSFSSYVDESVGDSSDNAERIRQPLTAAMIEDGKQDSKSEYYDVIYVGYWDGSVDSGGRTPYPIVDSVNVTQDWVYLPRAFSGLRLSGGLRDVDLPVINPKQKFQFSFISDVIPNPRAIFYIRGKRYLCEKITATFTENGMSQMLKGEFYPVVD